MPQYALFLRGEHRDMNAMSPSETQTLLERFFAWHEELSADERVLESSLRLKDDGGSVVRKRGDQLVVDGPYCEAKEMIGGLYIIQVKDEAEAIVCAKGCPLLDTEESSVEVRKVGGT